MTRHSLNRAYYLDILATVIAAGLWGIPQRAAGTDAPNPSRVRDNGDPSALGRTEYASKSAQLTWVIAAQDSSERHVRATEPQILALINIGLSRSATFSRLVATLNDSDVIVFVEPKLRRQALGGYLSHDVVARGGHRYVWIAVETHGAPHRLVSLLAHELQHAVEIAQAPDARDADSVTRLFRRLAVKNGCTSLSCLETQAAEDIQRTVSHELAAFGKDR